MGNEKMGEGEEEQDLGKAEDRIGGSRERGRERERE